MKIEIANPIGQRFCTPRNAERMIAHGKARWTGKKLQIIHPTAHHAHACAKRDNRPGYDAAANSGMATVKELRALPMTGNIARFLS